MEATGGLRRPWRLTARDRVPQSPDDIARDLGALNSEGGVPSILSEPLPGKSDWSVLLYTRRYLVRLFVTKFGDAYTMASVAPLRLRDHQRLAQGYLLTRPSAWLVADSPRAIPPGSTSGWDTLVAGWDQFNASLAATFRPTER